MEQIPETHESGLEPREAYDPENDPLIQRMDAFIARLGNLETMMRQVMEEVAFIRDILTPRDNTAAPCDCANSQ